MERIIKTGVTWNGEGLTVANYLAGRFTYRSLEEWNKRIELNEITVNGQSVTPDYILKLHDVIEYRPGDIAEPPADLDYTVVFEDEHLLVINKPGNLCVHPSGPYFKNTLWYLLKERFGDIHLINRLDRETSGLLIAAKSSDVAAQLAKAQYEINKVYIVMVHGELPEKISAKGFLFDDSMSNVRKKRKFAPGERPPQGALKIESSWTEIYKLESQNSFSLAAAQLKTGRMHQIRATMFSYGFPVVGDKLYGKDENLFLKLRTDSLSDQDKELLLLPCQALHSAKVTFVHPVTGKQLTFNAPFPQLWSSSPALPVWKTQTIPDVL
ncbi:MAG: RluA family pseudouridine synthase [Lentisphaerae bacterium]|nr:RluA family pseudouridine synthase [Lentisphaerota bacterium]